MEYLAYFRPGSELSDLILRQSHIILPGSGLHCTLCFFYMEPEQERGLVSDLSEIKFNPFEIETQDFDDYDEDSLALTLSRPDELFHLHKEILAVSKKYANPDFEAIAREHFGDEYAPHMTISKSSSGFDKSSKTLIGQKDRIDKYSLAKKVDGSWKEIEDFYPSG